MIVLHASIPVDPDERDDALDLFEDLVEASQQEDGMIEYHAATDVQDPHVVRFFEQYEDEAALEAHNESEHFQRFEAALPDLLDGEPEVTVFEVSDARDLDV